MSETPHTFNVGDRVVCNPLESPARFHGTVWVIERILKVNVILRPVDGGRGLRTHPSALLPAPADGQATSVTVPYFAPLPIGAVVTISAPRWKGSEGLYVVLADTGESLRLALLGGEQDRVWSKVPRRWATEIDKASLLDAVAELRPTA